MPVKMDMTAYILAKDEEANIHKCLESLAPYDIPVVLLDSGSSDRTIAIAQTFSFCAIQPYDYRDHATAYNFITTCAASHTVMILDADMEITPALWNELCEMKSLRCDWDLAVAPVLMCVEGRPLRFGSLYPPKAIVFKSGPAYFVPSGHGERVRHGFTGVRTRSPVVHNDLKPYSHYLLSQVRYGQNLVRRIQYKQASVKDRIKAWTPLGALVYPFLSYIIYGGFLSGRRGILYCIDRVIAALIQWRVAQSVSLHKGISHEQRF